MQEAIYLFSVGKFDSPYGLRAAVDWVVAE